MFLLFNLENPMLWVLILAVGGILLAAIVGGVVLILLISKRSQGTLKCPHCAETIRSEAKICRFCNRALGAA
jgi:hypothetical protein